MTTSQPNPLDIFRRNHTPSSAKPSASNGSEAARKRQARAAANELPTISPCADPARRESCRLDLRLFCETYFRERFAWAWSDDHLELIKSIQYTILNGALYLVVCPRGMGKSAILTTAAIWATAYGHRRYVVPIYATGVMAQKRMKEIRQIWAMKGVLSEDFPEIAEPIIATMGIGQRVATATYRGEPTHLEYSASKIAYPWLSGIESAGRGACIEPCSITGNLLGLNRALPDGSVIRPDFVMPDDIQTDESAKSSIQIRNRLDTLNTSVLGLAGPGVKLAGIMLGTIKQPGDVVDQLLHEPKYHAWGGRRMQLIYQWPEAQDTLWREYADLRRKASDATDPEEKEVIYAEATTFYAANREAMDKGARVQWNERRHPGDLSALQHAENLLIDRGEGAFNSEYQNDPQADETTASPLTIAGICERINRQRRWWIPATAEFIGGKIDIGESRLHFTVLAGEPSGTPYLIHYQTWPEKGNQTLSDLYPKLGVEARIYQGLEDLAASAILPSRNRDDGTPMKVQRLHVDNGSRPRLIERWCRQGCCAGMAHPEGGAKTGNLDAPLNKWRQRPGERRGDGWLIKPAQGGLRSVVADSNQWKTYLTDRLQTPLGAAGALTIFGTSPEAHEELAEHCTAEYPTAIVVSGLERKVYRMRPGKTENHYLDCLYGSFVALSALGCQVRPGAATVWKPRKAARAHVSIT